MVPGPCAQRYRAGSILWASKDEHTHKPSRARGVARYVPTPGGDRNTHEGSMTADAQPTQPEGKTKPPPRWRWLHPTKQARRGSTQRNPNVVYLDNDDDDPNEAALFNQLAAEIRKQDADTLRDSR